MRGRLAARLSRRLPWDRASRMHALLQKLERGEVRGEFRVAADRRPNCCSRPRRWGRGHRRRRCRRWNSRRRRRFSRRRRCHLRRDTRHRRDQPCRLAHNRRPGDRARVDTACALRDPRAGRLGLVCHCHPGRELLHRWTCRRLRCRAMPLEERRPDLTRRIRRTRLGRLILGGRHFRHSRPAWSGRSSGQRPLERCLGGQQRLESGSGCCTWLRRTGHSGVECISRTFLRRARQSREAAGGLRLRCAHRVGTGSGRPRPAAARGHSSRAARAPAPRNARQRAAARRCGAAERSVRPGVTHPSAPRSRGDSPKPQGLHERALLAGAPELFARTMLEHHPNHQVAPRKPSPSGGGGIGG